MCAKRTTLKRFTEKFFITTTILFYPILRQP